MGEGETAAGNRLRIVIDGDSLSALDITRLIGHRRDMIGDGVQLRRTRGALAAAQSCPGAAQASRRRLTQRRAIDFGTLTTTGCCAN
jgi:hypothetical protein